MSKKESMIVVDLETKKSFQEVGSRDKQHLLGISVAGVYDYLNDEYLALEEHELGTLEKLFEERDIAMGFNVKSFDWPVLQPYFNRVDLSKMKTLDLMVDIEKVLGFRVALSNLAKNTLGEGKSGHGLEAVEWFRNGEIEKVKKYCIDDVRLTRDLYEYGNNHGVIRFESRMDGIKTIPANWALANRDTKDIKSILEDAQKNKLMVEIDYISSKSSRGENARKKRNIEVHSVHSDAIEAYCHLRQDMRNFKIWRIVNANIMQKNHLRPTLF